jgi:tetratricopeptide (TPR) repeat protein
LDVCPDFCDAYIGIGAAFANQKRYQDAIKQFKKALSLNPDSGNAQKYLSACEQKITDQKVILLSPSLFMLRFSSPS